MLAPSVRTFGEDLEIDRLIRKYGYRHTPQIMEYVRLSEDLPQNLSAAAHLIHGTSEGRFRITYCPGRLTRGKRLSRSAMATPTWTPCAGVTIPTRCGTDGTRSPTGERIYFIRNPAVGLWDAPKPAGRLRALYVF